MIRLGYWVESRRLFFGRILVEEESSGLFLVVVA